MRISPKPAVLKIEVTPELWIVIPPRGATSLSMKRGWLVNETNGQVTVSFCLDLLDPMADGEPIYTFELPASGDRAEDIRILITTSFEVIIQATAEEDQYFEPDVASVRLISNVVAKSGLAPELIVATIYDALKDWHSHLIKPIDWFIAELELPSAIATDGDVVNKLRAAADYFQVRFVDVFRFIDIIQASDHIRWLPSPVAIPYARMQMPGSLRDRFHAVLTVFEALIRYLAVAALSPIPSERDEAIYSLAEELGRRPTLGTYARIIRDKPNRLRNLLPEVAGALQTSRRRWTSLGEFILKDVVEMRNRLGAHGGVMAEAAYAKPLRVLNEMIEGIVEPLAKDSYSTMVVVPYGVEVARGDDAYNYTLFELRGDSVALPVSRHHTNEKLDQGKAYIRHGNEFINIDPLILYNVCPQCNFEEAFFLDHFDPKTPQWFSFRGGHRIS